ACATRRPGEQSAAAPGAPDASVATPRPLSLWDIVGFGVLAGLNLLALLWFGWLIFERRQRARSAQDTQEPPLAEALAQYQSTLEKAATALATR
ncbi:MAG: hypothetical protein HC809_15070, partial [Gammaproteobacteria bacterium]|nr:hypothetical protein [Gammaproteobacteria bacterium]